MNVLIYLFEEMFTPDDSVFFNKTISYLTSMSNDWRLTIGVIPDDEFFYYTKSTPIYTFYERCKFIKNMIPYANIVCAPYICSRALSAKFSNVIIRSDIDKISMSKRYLGNNLIVINMNGEQKMYRQELVDRLFRN